MRTATTCLLYGFCFSSKVRLKDILSGPFTLLDKKLNLAGKPRYTYYEYTN